MFLLLLCAVVILGWFFSSVPVSLQTRVVLFLLFGVQGRVGGEMHDLASN